jgi:hypothetical protein
MRNAISPQAMVALIKSNTFITTARFALGAGVSLEQIANQATNPRGHHFVLLFLYA